MWYKEKGNKNSQMKVVTLHAKNASEAKSIFKQSYKNRTLVKVQLKS